MRIQVILCCVLAAIVAGAKTKKKYQNVFQDEVTAQEHEGSFADEGRRRVQAEFEGDDWQSGRQAVHTRDGKELYREPFALLTDEDIHTMVDLAYTKTLANLKERDATHDGILKGGNMREFLKLVMNPDHAPLSAPESSALESWISLFIKKQGFANDSMKPVKRKLLHAWSSLFLFRQGNVDLRALREANKKTQQEEQVKKAKAKAGQRAPPKPAAAEEEVQDVLSTLQTMRSSDFETVPRGEL